MKFKTGDRVRDVTEFETTKGLTGTVVEADETTMGGRFGFPYRVKFDTVTAEMASDHGVYAEAELELLVSTAAA